MDARALRVRSLGGPGSGFPRRLQSTCLLRLEEPLPAGPSPQSCPRVLAAWRLSPPPAVPDSVERAAGVGSDTPGPACARCKGVRLPTSEGTRPRFVGMKHPTVAVTVCGVSLLRGQACRLAPGPGWGEAGAGGHPGRGGAGAGAGAEQTAAHPLLRSWDEGVVALWPLSGWLSR